MSYGSLREKIAAEKVERQARYAKFAAAFDEANRAGYAAGDRMQPETMYIRSHCGPDAGTVYADAEGACGFAWVHVKDGTSSFARWLVKNGHARKSCYGGVDIWISAHNQSVERKQAHAVEMARVLVEQLGVEAYASSRLD
jgi:hypothetical protein